MKENGGNVEGRGKRVGEEGGGREADEYAPAGSLTVATRVGEQRVQVKQALLRLDDQS